MSHLLYQLYEHRLRRQIRAGPMPEHVGLILDGNRRYARKQGFPDPGRAYVMGAQKLDEVLQWCDELGIPAVTLWVCSTENLKRSHAEVSGILGAVEAKIGALAQDPWIHQRRVRVKAAGRLSLLPLSTVDVIRKAEDATADYDAMTLTIAVAYGGREEIADAVRDLIRAKVQDGLGVAELAEHITPAAIDQHLTPPASQIPASSSAPAARCGYRAFSYGNASIANSTSRTFIGRSSARSTSCARFARSSRESDALGSKAGDPSDRRSPQGAHSSWRRRPPPSWVTHGSRG